MFQFNVDFLTQRQCVKRLRKKRARRALQVLACLRRLKGSARGKQTHGNKRLKTTVDFNNKPYITVGGKTAGCFSKDKDVSDFVAQLQRRREIPG